MEPYQLTLVVTDLERDVRKFIHFYFESYELALKNFNKLLGEKNFHLDVNLVKYKYAFAKDGHILFIIILDSIFIENDILPSFDKIKAMIL